MRSIKTCIIIAALCCMLPAVAQKQYRPTRYTHMCSYYGEDIKGDITAFSAGPTAQKVIKKIMAVIGLKANFELREANVPNAAAVMLDGKRFILYNPEFMDKINSRSGTNWAAISILAHEIGHHLNGHTLDNVGSRPQTELDADEFSGFVLHKLGATLPESQAVMALISNPNGSKSHPAKHDRLAYIETGWNNAGDLPLSTPVTDAPQPKATVAATPRLPAKIIKVPQPEPAVAAKTAPKPTTVTVLNKPVTQNATEQRNGIEQSIAASVKSDVYFNNDPRGRYYLTAKGNLVQVENDRVYLVGSLYKSDRRGYSMMFAGNNANKIYVANGGVLVNDGGNRIGYMRSR